MSLLFTQTYFASRSNRIVDVSPLSHPYQQFLTDKQKQKSKSITYSKIPNLTFVNNVLDNLGSFSCESTDLEANLEIFNSIDNVTKNVVSMDGAKKALKEKCVNVSGTEAAYTRAMEGAETLKECAVTLIDLERMQNDIEVAAPKGELDTVFNKYEH